MRWIVPLGAAIAVFGSIIVSHADDAGQSSDASTAGVTTDKSASSEGNSWVLLSPDDAARAAEYWTPERMRNAKPMPLPDVTDTTPPSK